MDRHDAGFFADEPPLLIVDEMDYEEETHEYSYEKKKMKRRESDAKCRANISAGFDLLKEQVYATGNQEKVSKEGILQQSFVRIKYLEGILIALQHTKEITSGNEEALQKISPVQQLRNVHHQFVASQQRKWKCHSPVQRQFSKDVMEVPKDGQDVLRRLAKKKPPKYKYIKKSSPMKRKKCSPIIQLPPAHHTPSRPQKRIKLASTESHQDQVVPLSSFLSSATTPLATSTTKAGARQEWRRGSQTVPDSPYGIRDRRLDDHEGHADNLYTEDDGPPSSPLVDVCKTPCKATSLFSGSTPVKTYQIIGSTITPVKIDYRVSQQDERDDIPSPRVDGSPDLVCDEEPTSWPEDDSSSSSGSIPELVVNRPWFPYPARFTQPQKQSSKGPVLYRQIKARNRKKYNISRELSRDDINKENVDATTPKARCNTPRRKYRKRATAARVRAWDSATGRVLSPVQPYSGIFKSVQQRKLDAATKPKSPSSTSTNSIIGHTDHQLHAPELDFDVNTPPTCQFFREMPIQSDIVKDIMQESDEEIIDLLGLGTEDNVAPTLSLEEDGAKDPSPTCLRDVSLPPPTGTISPPSQTNNSSLESPELFKGFKSIWIKDPRRDNCSIAVDTDIHQEDNEAGFYDYQDQMSCDPPEDTMLEKEEDLFEADLGDVRHLDPALQPPSSSLRSEDYFCCHGNEMEDQDGILVMDDVDARRRMGRKTPVLRAGDVLITPALASFATSALSMKHAKKPSKKRQRRRGTVRLNLPKACTTSGDEDDDLNIWKFTQAALNETDVLRFLPAADSSYALITNDY